MSCQISCSSRCIVAFIAFKGFFFKMRFQMCSQFVWHDWCVVTTIAFVGLFTRASFRLCPQVACLKRCKIALVAIVFPIFSFLCLKAIRIYIWYIHYDDKLFTVLVFSDDENSNIWLLLTGWPLTFTFVIQSSSLMSKIVGILNCHIVTPNLWRFPN